MDTAPHNVSITKRPIIVTVTCCLILLFAVGGLLNLSTYFIKRSGSFEIDLKSLLGAKNYYIGILGGLISVLMFIPVIGILKMKKSAGYLFVSMAMVNIVLAFFVDTMPSVLKSSQQSAIPPATGTIISLTMIFIIFYHVIINNPKSAVSAVTQRQFGVLSAIIGIGLIFIAQTYKFTISQSFQTGNGELPGAFNFLGGMTGTDVYADTVKKNLFLYTGIATLIGGACFYALSLNVKGTEGIVSNLIQNRQPLASKENNIVSQIENLNELRLKGLLSEDEFAVKKAELLSKM
jgi:hypothetical protein